MAYMLLQEDMMHSTLAMAGSAGAWEAGEYERWVQDFCEGPHGKYLTKLNAIREAEAQRAGERRGAGSGIGLPGNAWLCAAHGQEDAASSGQAMQPLACAKGGPAAQSVRKTDVLTSGTWDIGLLVAPGAAAGAGQGAEQAAPGSADTVDPCHCSGCRMFSVGLRRCATCKHVQYCRWTRAEVGGFAWFCWA